MDKPVLIIEAPDLDDEAAASIYAFLQELVLSFESHYYSQLVRREANHHCSNLQNEQNDDEPFNDKIPF